MAAFISVNLIDMLGAIVMTDILLNHYDIHNYHFFSSADEVMLRQSLLRENDTLFQRMDSLTYCHGQHYMGNVLITFNEADEPIREYGIYEIGEIIKALATLIQELRGAESLDDGMLIGLLSEILSAIMSFENRDGESVHDFAERRRNVLDELNAIMTTFPAVKDPISKIIDMLHKIKIVHGVLGIFDRDVPAIVMYLKPILKTARRRNISPENVLRLVYAHELFHYYHWSMVKELHTVRWRYSSKHNCSPSNVVIESLAASFEYYYARDVLKVPVWCTLREKEWSSYDIWEWPYSGAYYITSQHIGCGIRKMVHMDGGQPKSYKRFREIFTHSLRDWYAAYKIIESLFYLDNFLVKH